MGKTGIDLGDIVDTKGPALTWFILAVTYLLGNFFIQWQTQPHGFPYAMTYVFAFFMIAVTVAKAWKSEKIGSVFVVMVFFVSLLTWMCSSAYIDPNACMWLSLVFTVIGLLNEYSILETSYSVNYKYALLGSFASIFLFGLLYFLGRLGFVPIGWPLTWWTGPLPWFTVLNHFGILLMALFDMVILFGFGDWEKWRMYRWGAFALALFGALIILATPGWGLGIFY